MLKQGDAAPDFTLPDKDGRMHRLSDYKGKKVVLYFYPKDMTPGCTKEACNFRDDFEEYRKRGIVLLGVNADNMVSHKKFAEKHNLPFPLLSDTAKEVAKKYGYMTRKNSSEKSLV